MGKTLSKKMLPLIILKILWEQTDEAHDISIEQLIHYISDMFYVDEVSDMARLIRSNIKQMNELFQDIEYSLLGRESLFIKSETYANPEAAGGYIKKYRLLGKALKETEAQLLCDSILFSPGIDGRESSILIERIKSISGKHFETGFDCVKRTDIVKRTNNENLYEMIDTIGKAIKKKRKICFIYRKNSDEAGRRFVVSPYHLVINAGKYYLLCNPEGKESISPYRVDKMDDVYLLEENPVRKICELMEVEHPFQLKKYLEEHPRMSFEKSVAATLLIRKNMLDAVASEFKITCVMRAAPETELLRVRVISTRQAICNWIINVSDMVRIEDSSDKTIISMLLQKAEGIIALYQPKHIQYIG